MFNWLKRNSLKKEDYLNSPYKLPLDAITPPSKDEKPKEPERIKYPAYMLGSNDDGQVLMMLYDNGRYNPHVGTLTMTHNATANLIKELARLIDVEYDVVVTRKEKIDETPAE